MTKTEHLLTCLIEECAEIQHAASKALRFGLNDQCPGKDSTNDRDIAKECCELIGVIELLEEEGIIKKTNTIQSIEQKKARVKLYMDYAKERGTLSVSADAGQR